MSDFVFSLQELLAKDLSNENLKQNFFIINSCLIIEVQQNSENFTSPVLIASKVNLKRRTRRKNRENTSLDEYHYFYRNN